MQSIVDESYDIFVNIVADGRELPKKTVRKIADGRIMTASQAIDKKLVDDLGDREIAFTRMFEKLAKEGKVTEVSLREISREKSFLGGLLGKTTAGISSLGKNGSDIENLTTLLTEKSKHPIKYIYQE
jgi:protease-4